VRPDVARLLLELGQVLADAETAAGPGDHDRANLVVLCLLQPLGDRPVHGGVQRVEDVRPVERDRQDRAVARGVGIGHAGTLRRDRC
jgi:hypothetical protein